MSELKINGLSIGPAEIRQLKPGVTVAEAEKQFAKDGYDQVVFGQGDKLFVAYGRNLQIPGRLNGNSIPASTLGSHDGEAVQIKWANNETNSFKEGALKRAIFLGAATGIGGALLSTVADWDSVLGAFHSDPRKFLVEGAAVAAAAATIGGAVVLHGGITAARNKPDDAPIKQLTQ